ncbi:MAG: REP-associated tyrosine transposase [Pseudoxanthomonas sp.]
MTHNPEKGHAALRRGRVSLAGQVYFVTFTTHGRRRVFAEPECAKAAARSITDRRLWQHSQLLAWVLMPDHWHGLVRLGDAQDLSRLIRKLKANTARCLTGHATPVWATAFHDHALRTDEDLVAHVRYLVMNPVRAGQAARVGDYPYWDAVWL